MIYIKRVVAIPRGTPLNQCPVNLTYVSAFHKGHQYNSMDIHIGKFSQLDPKQLFLHSDTDSLLHILKTNIKEYFAILYEIKQTYYVRPSTYEKLNNPYSTAITFCRLRQHSRPSSALHGERLSVNDYSKPLINYLQKYVYAQHLGFYLRSRCLPAARGPWRCLVT